MWDEKPLYAGLVVIALAFATVAASDRHGAVHALANLPVARLAETVGDPIGEIIRWCRGLREDWPGSSDARD